MDEEKQAHLALVDPFTEQVTRSMINCFASAIPSYISDRSIGNLWPI